MAKLTSEYGGEDVSGTRPEGRGEETAVAIADQLHNKSEQTTKVKGEA